VYWFRNLDFCTNFFLALQTALATSVAVELFFFSLVFSVYFVFAGYFRPYRSAFENYTAMFRGLANGGQALLYLLILAVTPAPSAQSASGAAAATNSSFIASSALFAIGLAFFLSAFTVIVLYRNARTRAHVERGLHATRRCLRALWARMRGNNAALTRTAAAMSDSTISVDLELTPAATPAATPVVAPAAAGAAAPEKAIAAAAGEAVPLSAISAPAPARHSLSASAPAAAAAISAAAAPMEAAPEFASAPSDVPPVAVVDSLSVPAPAVEDEAANAVPGPVEAAEEAPSAVSDAQPAADASEANQRV
jgi:hypothetical protein